MTNSEVIVALKAAIAKVKVTLNDLEVKKDHIGGPIEERLEKFNRIVSEMADLTEQLRALELRLIAWESATETGNAITPLTAEERTKVEIGLAELGKSIATVNDFEAVLKVAKEITDAAEGIAGTTDKS